MGRTSNGLRATLPGGRRINQKSQKIAEGLDTSLEIEDHLERSGLSLTRASDMDRYTSGLIGYHDALKRGESKANALQAGLSASKTSTKTIERQTDLRESKAAREKYRS